jgi:hypothetical protein
MSEPAAPRPVPPPEFCARLDADRFDADAALHGLGAPFAVAGAVLKSQGAVMRDVREGRRTGGYLACLAAAAILASAAYGAVLGLFQPGLQTLYAALKVPIVVVGTALLCTPTFYVFNSILGSRLTLQQTLCLVLFLSAGVGLVLVAFAPITWFFTVSTGGVGFLTVLHVAVFLIAFLYAVRSLDSGRRYLAWLEAGRAAVHGRMLALWLLLVLFVGLQMAYTFRPLILPGPFHSGERGLFTDALGSAPKPPSRW